MAVDMKTHLSSNSLRLGNIYSFRIRDSFVALQMSTRVCNNSCSSAFGSFRQQPKLKPASDDSRDGAYFLSPSRADKKDQTIGIRTVRGQWWNFSDSDFQEQTVQLLIRERAVCPFFSLFVFPRKEPRIKILLCRYIHWSQASYSEIFCFLHACFSYYYYFDSLIC